MAPTRRNTAEGLLQHSDRGCQYTNHAYRDELDALGVCVSRKGSCWDNAVAEIFFATLKRELVHRRRWSNRRELRTALSEYIEVFYNRRRLALRPRLQDPRRGRARLRPEPSRLTECQRKRGKATSGDLKGPARGEGTSGPCVLLESSEGSAVVMTDETSDGAHRGHILG
jgi:hypothetical protein